MRKFCDHSCKNAYFVEHGTDLSRLRDKVFDRDGGKCIDCGGWRFLETHHINGERRDNRLDNLVLLCKKCHVGRHRQLTGRNFNGSAIRT